MSVMQNKTLMVTKRIFNLMKENPEERYSINDINNYVSSGNNHTRMKQYVDFLLFLGVIEKVYISQGNIRYRYKNQFQSVLDTISSNESKYSNSGFNDLFQVETNELIKRFKKNE